MAQGKSAQLAALELDPRAKLEYLGAILLALFLFALDQTVVGTALPVIVTDLHGNDLYVWVVTIYLLTSTISGPIYGKLSDLFGRRPIIIFAVSLFLIASVLSWVKPVDGAADPVPRPPGPRRRGDLPGGAGRGRRPVHALRAGQVPRPVRGRLRGLIPDRAGDRRADHRHGWLALDLLRERADRPDLARHHLAAAAGDQAAGRGPEHRLPGGGGLRRGDQPRS